LKKHEVILKPLTGKPQKITISIPVYRYEFLLKIPKRKKRVK